jgi:hypothetical protein
MSSRVSIARVARLSSSFLEGITIVAARSSAGTDSAARLALATNPPAALLTLVAASLTPLPIAAPSALTFAPNSLVVVVVVVVALVVVRVSVAFATSPRSRRASR